MSDWIIPLIVGLIINPGVILFMDYLIRRIDDQHGLPDKMPIGIMIVSGIAGCYITKRFGSFGICVCILLVSLLIMAWTDYYTRHLYTGFSLITFLFGMIWLILRKGLIVDYIKFILIYLLVLSVLMFINAFSRGDVYLLAAASPFIFMYADIIHVSGVVLNLIFIFIAMLLCVIGNIKKLFMRDKQRVAFAPYVAAAFVILIIIF
jgi:prepilin signal peptidase PulO-like enzyme (type II secretory pathway)